MNKIAIALFVCLAVVSCKKADEGDNARCDISQSLLDRLGYSTAGTTSIYEYRYDGRPALQEYILTAGGDVSKLIYHHDSGGYTKERIPATATTTAYMRVDLDGAGRIMQSINGSGNLAPYSGSALNYYFQYDNAGRIASIRTTFKIETTSGNMYPMMNRDSTTYEWSDGNIIRSNLFTAINGQDFQLTSYILYTYDPDHSGRQPDASFSGIEGTYVHPQISWLYCKNEVQSWKQYNAGSNEEMESVVFKKRYDGQGRLVESTCFQTTLAGDENVYEITYAYRCW